MNKRNYLVALAFFTAINGYSQHFGTGLSLGGLVSDVQGTDTRDYDNDFRKVGFTAGVLVNRQVGEKTIAQVEINYIQKGAAQGGDSSNNGSFNLAFNYMEVPFLLRHRVQFMQHESWVNNFEWELGISGGYLFGFSYSANNYSLPLDPNYFNRVDVSILGGINYHIAGGLLVNLRYSNELIPVFKRSALPAQAIAAYAVSLNNGNNMVFQLCLKYEFGNRSDNVSTSQKDGEEDDQ